MKESIKKSLLKVAGSISIAVGAITYPTSAINAIVYIVLGLAFFVAKYKLFSNKKKK